MGSKIRRIGILTSGGDAPGMNAAIRAAVRAAEYHGINCIGVRRGFNGLINGDFTELGAGGASISGIISAGGTILYTARSPEFMTEEGVEKAKNTCRYLGIEGVIAIGGDGTFRGGGELAKHGIPVIGIPATIDNDIGCTHYSIGFDTACNTAIESIDKLRNTMQSHERCSVVEVMGRNAGHLALYVGIACGASAVLVPERNVDFELDIVDKIRNSRIKKRNHFIVIIAEGIGNCHEYADRIKEETGIDSRVTILGHVQRGGSPTVRDRVMASRMGQYAVDSLTEGRINRVVSIINGELKDFDIYEAVNMKKDLQEDMYETMQILSSCKA